ncbi:hypothetical protein E3N88_16581 [Mikania micrantha]|uniref:Uncharacterized protein n=1 Tax=Mikania micrantha TaxID=192012 RepID=A0A5N6P0H4_9ASTR|nr:hypothetical protein E3N88_16581 [Mikania micrantha]
MQHVQHHSSTHRLIPFPPYKTPSFFNSNGDTSADRESDHHQGFYLTLEFRFPFEFCLLIFEGTNLQQFGFGVSFCIDNVTRLGLFFYSVFVISALLSSNAWNLNMGEVSSSSPGQSGLSISMPSGKKPVLAAVGLTRPRRLLTKSKRTEDVEPVEGAKAACHLLAATTNDLEAYAVMVNSDSFDVLIIAALQTLGDVTDIISVCKPSITLDGDYTMAQKIVNQVKAEDVEPVEGTKAACHQLAATTNVRYILRCWHTCIASCLAAKGHPIQWSIWIPNLGTSSDDWGERRPTGDKGVRPSLQAAAPKKIVNATDSISCLASISCLVRILDERMVQEGLLSLSKRGLVSRAHAMEVKSVADKADEVSFGDVCFWIRNVVTRKAGPAKTGVGKEADRPIQIKKATEYVEWPRYSTRLTTPNNHTPKPTQTPTPEADHWLGRKQAPPLFSAGTSDRNSTVKDRDKASRKLVRERWLQEHEVNWEHPNLGASLVADIETRAQAIKCLTAFSKWPSYSTRLTTPNNHTPKPTQNPTPEADHWLGRKQAPPLFSAGTSDRNSTAKDRDKASRRLVRERWLQEHEVNWEHPNLGASLVADIETRAQAIKCLTAFSKWPSYSTRLTTPNNHTPKPTQNPTPEADHWLGRKQAPPLFSAGTSDRNSTAKDRDKASRRLVRERWLQEHEVNWEHPNLGTSLI